LDIGRTIMTGEKEVLGEERVIVTTSSKRNRTWKDVGLYPGFRGERPGDDPMEPWHGLVISLQEVEVRGLVLDLNEYWMQLEAALSS
jgi:hypothetical protein